MEKERHQGSKSTTGLLPHASWMRELSEHQRKYKLIQEQRYLLKQVGSEIARRASDGFNTASYAVQKHLVEFVLEQAVSQGYSEIPEEQIELRDSYSTPSVSLRADLITICFAW